MNQYGSLRVRKASGLPAQLKQRGAGAHHAFQGVPGGETLAAQVLFHFMIDSADIRNRTESRHRSPHLIVQDNGAGVDDKFLSAHLPHIVLPAFGMLQYLKHAQ